MQSVKKYIEIMSHNKNSPFFYNIYSNLSFSIRI